jgi:hypothetical protein
MKKQFSALIAALLITGFIALAMGVTSVNALLNKNGTVISNDPAAASSPAGTDLSQAQIAQLQTRVNEYQQREAQYQQLLQENQQQIQQYKQFVFAMQQAGLVRVRSDGTIVIKSRHFEDDD